MSHSVAALYDIHGNLPALEAVLDEVRSEGVDEIVVGGDVYPGPMSNAALDRLLALDTPVRFLAGNGERGVLELTAGDETTSVPAALLPGLRWCAERLGDERRRLMEAWPMTLRLELGGLGSALFCHATPQSDTAIFTSATPEAALLPHFLELDVPLVVCGHTHMQFDRRVGSTRVVNAGSVGMPFGETGAYWLLLGPGVELRRTPYDTTAAAARIDATEHPEAAAFAPRMTHSPPSEEEMLARFAPAEIGRRG